MKKILFLFLMSILFYAISGAEIRIALPTQKDTSAMVVEDGRAQFRISQFKGTPGFPNLPSFSVKLLMPDDADMASLTLTLQDIVEESFTNVDVTPAIPEPQFGSYPKPANIINGRDVTVYNKNAFYPASYIGAPEKGVARVYKVVDAAISPYLYNPVTKTLKHIKSATVVATYTAPAATLKEITPPPASDAFSQKILETLTEQADNVSTLKIKSAAGTGVLAQEEYMTIMTTNEVYTNSKQLGRFVKSKESRNFTVTIVTENKRIRNSKTVSYTGWGGGIGVAAAEKMKTWLKANYKNQTYPINYLLLIGNPDPLDGDVPMKRTDLYKNKTDWWAQAARQKMTPTDFYYSEMDSNWAQKEMDGESTISWDINPDLVVGRIPVYTRDDQTDIYGQKYRDLDIILARIIRYENIVGNGKNPSSENILTHKTNALLMRGNLWGINYKNLSTYSSTINEIKDNLNKLGWTSIAFPLKGDSWHYRAIASQTWSPRAHGNNPEKDHELLDDLNKMCGNVLSMNPDGTGSCDTRLERNENYCECTYNNQNLVIDFESGKIGDCNKTTNINGLDKVCGAVKQRKEYYCNCSYKELDDSGKDPATNYLVTEPSELTTEGILNSHHPGIVMWYAHGWNDSTGGIFDRNHAANLRDRFPSHFIQMSCLNGWADNFDSDGTTKMNSNNNNLSSYYANLLNNAVTATAATRVSGSGAFDPGIDYAKRIADVSKDISIGDGFTYNFKNDANFGWANRLIYTLYGDPTLGIFSYKYNPPTKTKDQKDPLYDGDGDGIRDEFDNCIGFYNPFQEDIDLDGKGECSTLDSDGDGTNDSTDKCPTNASLIAPGTWCTDADNDLVCDSRTLVTNSCDAGAGYILDNGSLDNCLSSTNTWESAPNTEMIYGVERTGVAGKGFIYDAKLVQQLVFNVADNLDRSRYIKFDIAKLGQYGYTLMWQPDHDMDGIGDKCDTQTTHTIAVAGMSDKVEQLAPAKKEGNVVEYTTRYTKGAFSNLSINHFGAKSGVTGYNNAVYFCGTTDPNMATSQNWGKLYNCTTALKDYNQNKAAYKSKPLIDYGYSHGTDPGAFNNLKATWHSVTFASSAAEADSSFTEELTKTGQGGYSPVYTHINKFIKFNEASNTLWSWRTDYCKTTQKNSECQKASTFNKGAKLYYALSVAPVTNVSSETYTKDNKTINPKHFINTAVFARSFRLNSLPGTAEYTQEDKTEYSYYVGGFEGTDYDHWRYEFMRRILGGQIGGPVGPDPWEDDIFDATAGAFILPVYEHVFLGANDNIRFITKQFLDGTVSAVHDRVGSYYALVVENQSNFGLYKGSDSVPNDWMRVGSVTSLPAASGYKTAYYKNTLYVSSITAAGTEMNLFALANNGSGFTANYVASIQDIADPRIAVSGNDLVVAGSRDTNLELFSLESNGQFREIGTTLKPEARFNYGLYIENGRVVVADGFGSDGTELTTKFEIDIKAPTPIWIVPVFPLYKFNFKIYNGNLLPLNVF